MIVYSAEVDDGAVCACTSSFGTLSDRALAQIAEDEGRSVSEVLRKMVAQGFASALIKKWQQPLKG